MKKHLVVLGIVSIFFAGNSYAAFPEFTKAAKFDECKNGTTTLTETGAWINAPLSGELSCLKTGETNKKDKTVEGACDGLDFDITRHGTSADGKTLQDGVEVTRENKEDRYVVKDPAKVSCDQGKCSLADFLVEGKPLYVTCYKDKAGKDGTTPAIKAFSKITTDAPTNNCVVDYNDLRIKEIDYPRSKSFEWYCPYSWNESYPSTDKKKMNPYDPVTESGYFKKNLYGKEGVYKYLPEDQELIKDCSSRMFALSKACLVTVGKNSGVVEKIRDIRDDFYKKSSIVVARVLILKETGIAALNHWNEVKDISFKKICNLQKDGNGKPTNCKAVDPKETPSKKTALKLVISWLELPANKGLRDKIDTPQGYIENILKDVWQAQNGKTVKNYSIEEGALSAADVRGILEGNVSDIWGKDSTNESDKKKLKSSIGKIYKDGDFEFEGISNWGNAGGTNANDEFSKLIVAATEKENSAKLISKYIAKRNMDLNISISVQQTSSIDVSSYLQVIGDSKEGANDGSQESRLTLFDTGDDDINILNKIIQLAVRTMGTLAILLLIISGVLMVVSQGDENQLAKAKSTFLYTLIGLIVGFLSYTIVRFIIDTLLS